MAEAELKRRIKEGREDGERRLSERIKVIFTN
jgi:hypothetical protein